MAKRYRLEDEDERELEDNKPEDELDDEEEEQQAQDEDEDEELEEGDEEHQAEGEDDEPTARKRAKSARSLLNERKRCAGLMSLAKTAARLGVKFDAAHAIANGLNLHRARHRVLLAAANADREQTISPYAKPQTRNFGGVSQAKAAAMWKQAKQKGKRSW